MPDNKWLPFWGNFYVTIAFIGFSALWYSKAVVSVCTALLALSFLANVFRLNLTNYKGLFIGAIVLLLPTVTDLFISGFQGEIVHKIGLISGFVACLLAGTWLLGFSKINLTYYGLVIGLIVMIINVLAVANYFQNKDTIDALLLQSKSIPIPYAMHHIHFGVINGISVLLLIGILHNYLTDRKFKIITTLILVVIVMSMHILSSRTGLVSLYVAVLASVCYYVLKTKRYKVLLISVIAFLTIGLGTYMLSNSFRNKVQNSVEDVHSWGLQNEMNHKSMAMRIEGYKAAAYTIKHNPLGVGVNNLDRKMEQGYNAIHSPLWSENRKRPHNQFLEYGVSFGWLGMLAIVYFVVVLFKFAQQRQYTYFGFMVLLLVAFQFESLLERQTSLYFLGIFIPLFIHLFTSEKVKAYGVSV
jgi:O-antigen ligase